MGQGVSKYSRIPNLVQVWLPIIEKMAIYTAQLGALQKIMLRVSSK